ncbi:General stress protein 26 [Micromonospora echinaurantiaca]|uniref:General stress protein 26 n=1 Tax=Micromonospora echinaurantiaca TaxID=47857 RepID=A0A1C5H5W9_9ACTN|nr:General stress protein 26 [Micromonospora echinaurantiaca]
MSEPSTTAEARRRVTELVRRARICMLTTTGLDGRMVSRPMGLQEAEFDGDLWFFAYADSAKVRQLRVNPEVNVAFSDPRHQSWVSVSGTAQEGYDRATAQRLWHPMVDGVVSGRARHPGDHPDQGARRFRRVLGLAGRRGGQPARLRQGRGDRHAAGARGEPRGQLLTGSRSGPGVRCRRPAAPTTVPTDGPPRAGNGADGLIRHISWGISGFI